tara:strand:- start:82 stop:333 length:252 start_codon:yes stop_codon:yes gene_type:complete
MEIKVVKEVKKLHKGAKFIQLFMGWMGRLFLLSGVLILFSEQYSPVGIAFIFVGILLHLSIFNYVYKKNYKRVIKDIKRGFRK